MLVILGFTLVLHLGTKLKDLKFTMQKKNVSAF